MKTLDEILKRNDYVRLNSALNERVSEIAEKLRKKMNELDVEELNGYVVVNGSTNCGSYHFLGSTANEEACYDHGHWYSCHSLEDDHGYYIHGNFNHWLTAASHAEKLEFLNSARELFDALDEIETEKCAACEKALKENENL